MAWAQLMFIIIIINAHIMVPVRPLPPLQCTACRVGMALGQAGEVGAEVSQTVRSASERGHTCNDVSRVGCKPRTGMSAEKLAGGHRSLAG
jgi:hypothetical protein